MLNNTLGFSLGNTDEYTIIGKIYYVDDSGP
jgi:hypothetical protein